MTTARSFGNYDLPGALADLIDNSIKARAKNVRVHCVFSNVDPVVRIIDDGCGMSPDELQVAMRPASTNPTVERSPDDLGRFGWGMKSASFSQCMKLTVVSRKNGELSAAVWDLDDVDNWKMGVLSEKEIETLIDPLLKVSDGTEIIWNKCDRLFEGGTLTQEQFNHLIVHTRNQLSLTFHRFLAGEVRGCRLSIYINGTPIAPYDPFYSTHLATQALGREEIRHGRSNRVRIQPYILPHYSKLVLADFDRLSGAEGLLRNQGFYVYRQNRLIISGTWFRLVKHGELSHLVRIAIDIPNTLDSIWKISVDKSDAQLPAFLRNRLLQIIGSLRNKSAKVIRSKGAKIATGGNISVWNRHVHDGQIRYLINRTHPVIEALFDPKRNSKATTNSALQIIEQSMPVNNLSQDLGGDSVKVNQVTLNPRTIIEQLEIALPSMLLDAGGAMERLTAELRRTEPFAQNWKLVEGHIREKGWIK
ncbi:ATP-binding protein [Gemmobacter caeruleus]|uniref:ATP-binding protein n=1 Tax=Gemmobacter caeruleus TaxID=2595004 RepID=UPI0011EE8DC5|nr:ATP-binding protein [Gemmobacter caeruleus]